MLSLPSNCPLLYTLIPSTTTSTPTTTALRPNIYLHLQPLSTLSPSHPIPYIANAHSPLSIAFHSLRLRPARHHYHHSFACLRLLALALDPHYTTPQPHPPLPTNNSAATPLSSPLLPSLFSPLSSSPGSQKDPNRHHSLSSLSRCDPVARRFCGSRASALPQAHPPRGFLRRPPALPAARLALLPRLPTERRLPTPQTRLGRPG